jgi:hypothetical protein
MMNLLKALNNAAVQGVVAVGVSAGIGKDIVSGLRLMVTLIVIPVYVSTLLKRSQQSRARTEQALKECLERERAGVA